MMSRRVRVLVGAVAVLAVAAVVALRARKAEARYVTAAVDRGDVAEVVGATGTVQAVTTVQVGSQVSGTIQSLHADFNTVVKKGRVIARLDPSLFDARLGQAKANLVAAQANVEKSRSAVDDAKQKYERARELAAESLLPQSDLDTAKANYDGAVAQVKANEAAVRQAQANVNQAQVDLDHTIITAPIDGIVIQRSVDVGQTVAASFQAPVLFVIANDLQRMQVNASIDEADIGRVRPGQDVTFRVDAYPDRTFDGRVEQVRLQPTTAQNVVTYNTIITVENPEQRLMPGMTATVSVIVQSAQNALRVPTAAIRFRPEGFEEGRRGERRGGGGGAVNREGTPGPGGAREGREGGGARQGQEGSAPSGGGDAERWRRDRQAQGSNGRPDRGSAGVPSGTDGHGPEGRPGLLFVLNESGKPEPRRVRLGISDGQFIELREGLEEGTRVVTGIEGETGRGAGPRPGGSPSTNPFSPQFQRRQR
jgi:HlyD family secretion protein